MGKIESDNNKNKQVADRILKYIKEKGYVEGDRLPPERELSNTFGVSRSTVREALKKLNTVGFIESKYGSGTYVKKVNFEAFLDPLYSAINTDKNFLLEIIEVRKMLECETAGLAAKRINADKTETIKRAIDSMKEEIDRGLSGIEGDSSFHMAVAEAADNEALRMILEMCRDILNTTRTTTLRNKTEREKALADHRKIAEAILSGNEEKAVFEMKKHLETAYANISLIQNNNKIE